MQGNQESHDQAARVSIKNPELHGQASARELKSRLNGGEPGLTIIDIRSSDEFRHRRLLGAINIPAEDLLSTVQDKLELTRDIYLYGASEEETTQAAESLRQAGYRRVAALQGGVDAFAEIGGSLEGISTNENAPSPDNYNVFARLEQHSKEKAKENSMK